MVYNYNLGADDFLNLHLYYLSTDENAKRQRRNLKYRVVGLSILFGLILLFDGGYDILAYFFLASGVFFFLIYPWWSTWFYRRMYKRQIGEQLKNKFPYYVKLILNDENIEIETIKGLNQIYLNTIDSIIEIDTLFIIKISDFENILIPKNEVVNEDDIRSRLMFYAQKSGISYIEATDWQWK